MHGKLDFSLKLWFCVTCCTDVKRQSPAKEQASKLSSYCSTKLFTNLNKCVYSRFHRQHIMNEYKSLIKRFLSPNRPNRVVLMNDLRFYYNIRIWR